MTAAVSAAAIGPLAPVLGALSAMTGQYPVHGLVDGLYLTERAGWVPAERIVSGDGFDDLLDAAVRRWDAPPHVAGALAWKCYAYWVSLPAVLGYATARRVPLLVPSQVLVRYVDHQPFLCAGLLAPRLAVLPGDPLAALDLPGVTVVDDEAALLGELRATLLDAHLAPLVERMHNRLRLGRRTLWGSLAAGVAHGVSRAADVLPGSTLDVTTTLLSSLGLGELVDLTAHPTGRLTVNRRTCCLAFGLPKTKICTGCVIQTAR
ncbi:MAG: hypothetical protein QOE03_2379 [Micromonosporaceae bacterium]|nr:hypothetical protein [Micromonosporaceae bacterium]